MMTKIRNNRHSKWSTALMFAAVVCFLGMDVGAVAAADDCPVIDDMPMGIQIKGSPPLIMFTIDDSGSMSYSITLEDKKFPDDDGYNHWKTGGMFKRPGGKDVAYIFDDPGDHTYNRDLKGEGHLYWYTQFSNTNKMFYNPSVTYAPWPRWDDEDIIEDAPTWSDPKPETEALDMDPDNPRSNPMKDNYTIDLDDIYYSTGEEWGVILDNMDSGAIGIHQGIVIDNEDPDCTFSDPSDWSESSADDEYPDPTHGEHSDYAKDEGDWAEWTHTFTADEAGKEYYVEVWFCHWDNRDDEAEYTITYDPADGSDDTVDIINDVSQRDEDTAGSWQNLYALGDWGGDVKTYTVAEGDTITVRVTRADDDDDGSTSADAVRFLDVATPPMYVETGTWDESGSKPEWNGDSKYTEEVGATATWTHQFTSEDLENGSTFVAQAWWNCYDGRNENAQFTISKNSVDQDVVKGVNQREGTGQCGQWVTLGDGTTYSFSEGDWGTITLTHTGVNNGSSVADAVRFISTEEFAKILDIKNCHYYIHTGYDGRDNDGDGNTDEADENGIYLVNLDDGDFRFYLATEDDDGKVIQFEETTAEKAGLDYITERRSYKEERINFANWFSFHRRRLLTAKNAIGNVITDMQNVYIGLLTIHRRIKQEVLPVKVSHEGDTWDETTTLLEKLYRNYKADGGTPLRKALKDTGRYFQGNYMKPSDSDIYESYTTSSYYPFYKPADGGACQQSFCILMTDGFWNNNSPDVGNEDKGGSHNTDYDGGEFADNYSNTLADVAMLYYEIDLKSNLENLVQSSDIDPATHQRMVTYGLSFGAKGTLDPEAYPGCPGKAGSCPNWPDPTDKENDERVDDLYHAAINGRGLYLNAGSPEELLDAMRQLKEDIEARGIRTEASAAVNSQELQTDTQLFVTGYNTFGWSGAVTAWDIDEDDGSIVTPMAWNAADVLETRIQDNGHGDRLIATFDGTDGIAFSGDLTGTHSDLTEKLVNYIRGHKDQEQRNNGSYRNRLTNWEGEQDQMPFTLGDIVHSSPAHYEDMLYVGANDGMLHAFSAVDGSELFAYVPQLVHGNLKSLADAEQKHKYYVDLSPTVRDIGSVTVLVGGLGKGGKGYFALDVTDAKTAITDQNTLNGRVLWEFTDGDDMGYSFSKPVITETDAGYVLVFGNGYGSKNGEAILYAVNPKDGTVLKKFETGVTGTDDCNGMSTPFPADTDNDGKTEFIYVGDLKGNMWKIDVRGSNPTNAWDFAFASESDKPLFTAMDSDGNPQPITGRPDVTEHCSGIGQMVVFGTGQLLGTPDVGSTKLQTLYGIWDFGDNPSEYVGEFDHPTNNTIKNGGDEVAAAGTDLTMLEQTLESGSSARVFTDTEPAWTVEEDDDKGEKENPSTSEPVNIGWYFDLPEPKERITQPVLIRSGKALVVSNIPGGGASVCEAGGIGSSYLMAIDPCTGGRVDSPPFDIDGDGVIDENDMVTITDPDTGEEVDVAPTGIEIDGLIYAPAIITSGEQDYLYNPTNPLMPGDPMAATGANIGMTFWRQHF